MGTDQNKELSRALRSKKYFLWDFDGCFCDSERFHFLAYAEAFRVWGHDLTEAEYYPSFTHLGEGVPREIERHSLTCDPTVIAADKKKAYQRLIETQHVPLFPEIPDIVTVAKQRLIQNAIASNSPDEEILAILLRNGFHAQLDLVLGRSASVPKKPAPDLFLLAMQKLGAKPEEALVLEDSRRGLQAARNAGVEAIWIRTRFNADLAVEEPHLASLTHAQFLALLKNLD